jgi:histidinol phosphatase-like enzyme
MKALFLDIDGVIQSPSDQNRFEHVEEFVDLSKRLTKELNNGFDYFNVSSTK